MQAVSDNATNSVYGNGMEFKDGATAITEYEYDKNGNLTKDLNKNISDIQYNCLNLPSRVTFANGDSIRYEYAADGTKLRTVHTINGTTTTTDYCGNAVYENGELKMLLNDAGYVSFPDKKFHFYIKDHQGNVRVVADAEGNVEEVNDYYPFGGLMSNATGNEFQKYKYNGKELDRKAGLNLYDYGARFYDPAIGRWHVVDPMSEEYSHLSPYNYCDNDPANRIDPDGMQSRYNWEKKRYEDENGNEVSWETVVMEYQLDGGPEVSVAGTELQSEQDDNDQSVDGITGAAIRITPVNIQKFQSNSSTFAPAIPWYLIPGETVGNAISKLFGVASIIFTLQGDTSPEYVDEATDSSKNEKHGDGGRTLEKDKKRTEGLQNDIKQAPNRKERNKLKKKLQNIRKNGELKRKGEEHSR